MKMAFLQFTFANGILSAAGLLFLNTMEKINQSTHQFATGNAQQHAWIFFFQTARTSMFADKLKSAGDVWA
jgi:hypothetical protein